MFDPYVRPLIQAQFVTLAKKIAPSGLSANAITFFAFLTAFFIFAAAGTGLYWLAGILFLVNRALDGLDGAVARLDNETSAFGHIFDRFSDVFVLGGSALIFAITQNGAALAATFLIFCLLLDVVSAFGLEILRGTDEDKKNTGFFFIDKLVGNTETLIAFALMFFMPAYFPVIAVLYGVALLLTVAGRAGVAVKIS